MIGSFFICLRQKSCFIQNPKQITHPDTSVGMAQPTQPKFEKKTTEKDTTNKHDRPTR